MEADCEADGGEVGDVGVERAERGEVGGEWPRQNTSTPKTDK